MSATPGSMNSETLSADTAQATERLREAGESAARAARNRTAQAQEWARSQWSNLQDRVESQPYQASAWALGIGFVAGILLMSLMRSSRS